MPKVSANGIEVYYETAGEGEPLLLIAGFGCDRTIWSLVAPALTSNFHVITFDNRGVGLSSAPDVPYSIEQMADDAAGLLDAIGVKRAHVAGHSMGGQIALALSLARPEKIRSLTLVTSGARFDEHNRAIIESWGELPRQVDAAMGARLSLPWVHSRRFYSRPGAIQQVIELIAANPTPPAAHAIYHQSRAISRFDASKHLAAIRCPTLVVAAREDILLPPAFSEELARGISGAELAIVEETAHGLLIESPEEVGRVMHSFLARH
jgi:pimeloyl-ACP methyl ester carboxylesterase